MTAINENGQVFFTFEELDLVGAIEEIEKEIHWLKVEAFNTERLINNFGYELDKNELDLYGECLTRPFKLMAIIELIRRYM
jgi:hypothetical protein